MLQRAPCLTFRWQFCHLYSNIISHTSHTNAGCNILEITRVLKIIISLSIVSFYISKTVRTVLVWYTCFKKVSSLRLYGEETLKSIAISLSSPVKVNLSNLHGGGIVTNILLRSHGNTWSWSDLKPVVEK